LAQADIVNDEQIRTGPALDALRVSSIGEPRMQVIEQVDATRVAHRDSLLASAKSKCLEDVALAGAGLARDHEVVLATHEVEPPEFEHARLVDPGLERPVEGLERLAFHEPAGDDASLDAQRQSLDRFEAEDVLEQCSHCGALARSPREPLVELCEGDGQSEDLEVSA
jgi:hypothetical protein